MSASCRVVTICKISTCSCFKDVVCPGTCPCAICCLTHQISYTNTTNIATLTSPIHTMAEDTNDGDPHHTAEEPRVPDIPPIQHTISTPAEAPTAPEAPDSFNFITAYPGPGHWIERLVNLPLHTGSTHATRSLVQVFSYRSPEQ